MKYPHVVAAEKYVKQVLADKIPACKWTRLACSRHEADKKRKLWKFDKKRAEDACRFVERFPHTKGKWAAANEPFVLEPWQCFLVVSVFGWVDRVTDKRRFRRALLLVPRKNGKSDLAARIGLYMFAADKEFGAEVYSGATSEKQAWEVFRPAKLMAERSQAFQEFYGVQAMKSNLHIPGNGSRFEPVIGKPGDGASPSCAIVDEYHEHPDDTLLDTMMTGMGAREQPLALIITTAGDNLGGPCYAMQQDLQKVLEGTVEDDRLWGVIYGIDEEDDWSTEAANIKANPNYNISVSAQFLRDEQAAAIRNSAKQGIYKTKHQNVWLGATNAYFNLESWKACMRAGITAEDFKGRRLFAGLDLASTKDIAAIAMLFEIEPQKEYAFFGKFYLPEAAIARGANQHYQGWAHDGHLILTPGDMIDYDRIEKDIAEIHAGFNIAELGFDPRYAPMLVQHLMSQKITCVQVPPHASNLSGPMQLMDGLILAKRIRHDGNPAMTWMVSNVVNGANKVKDVVYPNKERADAKIDGPVALMLALNRAIAGGEGVTYSGVRSLS
jgi:phage terminase large subunit-like protein